MSITVAVLIGLVIVWGSIVAMFYLSLKYGSNPTNSINSPNTWEYSRTVYTGDANEVLDQINAERKWT